MRMPEPVAAAVEETVPAPTATRRRWKVVLLVVLLLGAVGGLATANRALPKRAPAVNHQAAAVLPRSDLPFKIVTPDRTDGYTRVPDDVTVRLLLEQLRSAGIEHPAGASYVSDREPRDTVLVYGATGTAFGRDPDLEIAAAFDGLRHQGLTLGEPVALTLPAIGGRGACVSTGQTSVCVFYASAVFLVFRFEGPGTAAPADAAAQVPLLAFDLVKPT
jgi:hypothetical protein